MITTPPSQFFFGLLLAAIVLAVLIFMPFLTPIVLAAALAVVAGPAHRLMIRILFRDRERSSLAAVITTILIIVVICVPVLLVAGKIYTEVQTMYAFLTDEAGRSQVITSLNAATSGLSRVFLGLYPAYSFDSFNITTILQRALEWLFANLDVVFGGVSKIALSVFIMCLALFYFLRDGRELKRQIISLSPLGDADDERIFGKLEQTIYSIFAGSISVGIVQGVLTGIGFAIFGVPSPALWGSIAAISALIPGIGTALVIVPGVAYLFFTGATGPAIGLLIWGVVAVGFIDNFLAPIIINRRVKIHPFMILLSVLGGLIFFGPVGFVLGPIALAFLFALLDIYKTRPKVN
ncbi:MAG: AI-2E family transporter [Patescibacteria group bacterium]